MGRRLLRANWSFRNQRIKYRKNLNI